MFLDLLATPTDLVYSLAITKSACPAGLSTNVSAKTLCVISPSFMGLLWLSSSVHDSRKCRRLIPAYLLFMQHVHESLICLVPPNIFSYQGIGILNHWTMMTLIEIDRSSTALLSDFTFPPNGFKVTSYL